MTKRAPGKFPRRKQDQYFTPPEAVRPLLGHLPPRCHFVEPCAGAGDLADELERHGHECVAKWDIDPKRGDIECRDAFDSPLPDHADYCITNCPWSRPLLHPMIDHFSASHPTWLLFDADWMHTRQATPYLNRCVKIVSVGRVSWMGNGVSGLDNAAFYLFDANHIGPTRFYGRSVKKC